MFHDERYDTFQRKFKFCLPLKEYTGCLDLSVASEDSASDKLKHIKTEWNAWKLKNRLCIKLEK